ncbi:MAG: hypothetical protein GX974_03605 [Clostridiales bacterium]|nr:hypothetical protein [Clostridiales bacterium]
MKNHYERAIEMADRKMESFLKSKKQEMRVDSRNYGGIIVPKKGFAEPAHIVGTIDSCICLYYNERSSHYGDKRLLERANIGLDFLLNSVHEDGTMDLLETNFHDATVVSFAIQPIAYTYRVLIKYTNGSAIEKELERKLYTFFEKTSKGLREGGFHTPNHRWVLTSALSLVYNILGDESLREEAMLYLREGIDCDEEGEYTERSTGVYNVINNRSLIIIAQELNMPQLYEHVERNLSMMFHYIEPDYSLCTMNSRRQDYGSLVYPDIYYENYLIMASKTGNPHFAWMCDFWFNVLYHKNKAAILPYEINKAPGAPMSFAKYMLDMGLKEFIPERMEEPSLDGEKFFTNSGIVRYRDRDISWTLVKDKTPFLKFQHGEANIHVRLSASFFGVLGRFIPQDISKLDDGGYRISYKKQWGYKRPFDEPVDTSVWDEMDHSKRKDVMMQDYIVDIDIHPQEDGIMLGVQLDGVENLPYKLELLLQPEGSIDSRDLSMPTLEGGYTFFKSNSIAYTFNDSSIEIVGGFCEHEYGPAMRGSDPQDQSMHTLYVTGFTRDRRQLTFKAIK